MKFNAEALALSIGFVAVLLLAVGARQGNIDPRFGIAGIAAIITIEVLLTVAPILRRR